MPLRRTKPGTSRAAAVHAEPSPSGFLAALAVIPRWLIITITLLAALAAMSVFYTGVALNVPYEADQATMVVMGQAVLDGNPLLKGWALGNQAYYTTELPFYAIGVWLMGVTWKVMYVLTGLHWAMLAIMTVLLSLPNRRGSQTWSRALIAFCLTMFMPALLVNTFYLSNAHLVGFFYCMVSLLAIRNLEDGGSTLNYAVYTVFLVLALIGDVFPVFVLAAPVMLVCGARTFFQSLQKQWLILLGLTTFSVVAAKAVLALTAALAGARIPGPPTSFIALAGLQNNLYLFLQGSLELFTVQFLGLPVASVGSGIGLLHLSGMLLFVAAVYHYGRQIHREDFYTQLLVAIVLVNVAANLLSNAVRPGTTRYLVPILIFSIPLVTLFVVESTLFAKRRLLILMYFLLLAISLVPPLSFSKPVSQADGLARLLLQSRLKNGYGPYWRSNSSTVATAGQVTIRPVQLIDGGRIAPCPCFASADWYSSPANFLVVNTDDTSDLQPSVQDAARVFGQPAASYTLGQFGYLLVWEHDITPFLSKP